jgi:hypothetical protein
VNQGQPGAPAQPTGHGPPPAAGYNPAPQQPGKVNILAIITLVTVFVATPLALLLGVIALVQIARTGQRGRWMAWAGIVAGGLFLAVIVGIAIFEVFVLTSGDWHF